MRTMWIPALLLGALVGCAEDPAAVEPDDGDAVRLDPQDTVVEVSFHDASVAPEHHRSWTITADARRVRAVADSYGEVLEDSSRATPTDLWEDLLADLPELLERRPGGEEEGCAGGTSLDIEVDDGHGGEHSLAAGSCGADRAVAEVIGPLVELAGEEL